MLKKIFIPVALFFIPLVTRAQGIFNIWEGTSCAGPTGVVNPCNLCDGLIVTRNIISSLFEVSLVVAGVMVAVGGIMFMTAGGSQDKVKQARKTVTSALIGLVIALMAWTIINTLLSFIAGSPALPWNQISC